MSKIDTFDKVLEKVRKEKTVSVVPFVRDDKKTLDNTIKNKKDNKKDNYNKIKKDNKDKEVIYNIKDKKDNYNILLYDEDILLEIINEVKYKILILCIKENKTSKQLAEYFNCEFDYIKNYIRRKNKDIITGLLPDNLIEIVGKESKLNIYRTTKKGINKILELQKQYEKQKEIEEKEEIRRAEAKAKAEEETRRTTNIIILIEEFIDKYYSNKLSQKELVRIDFKKIARYDSELGYNLLDNFEVIKSYFELALYNLNEGNAIQISFYNIPETEKIKISSLDYKNYDKLVMIEGLIRSRSERKSKVTLDIYECKSCGEKIILSQNDKFLKLPKSKCKDCDEKSWFLFRRDLVTVQRLEVEEFSEDLDGVNEPRYVNLLLINDLCKPEFQKHFNPGTRIKFWGVLKSEESYIQNRKKVLLDHYIEVNGFEVLEQSLEFNVSEKEQKEIIELSKRKDIIQLLINSFSPEIFGNKQCKYSLLLSAVKGYSDLPIWKRDRIHVMFVGNPGSGKTVMIKKLIELTKLSRFASGLNSSKVGLMAGVVQDNFIGGWKLSAGAVPLANNGICAIDEFDKIPDEDKKSMNSAMEEGEIIVDKASIHQKLLANTTIISTCNPKGERFDDKINYYLQYNLPKSLIDRFDIIFVINADVHDDPFSDIIKEIDFEVINEDLLSKYIIMAQNYNPKVSKDILIYLAKKGSDFKKKWKDNNFIFGFRQFNSVRNIMYAIGRLKLLDEITNKEVDEAFELYKSSVESQQYDILD